MRKAIFTCIFADYDQLNQAPSFPGWDCILITDKSPKKKMGWQVMKVDRWDDPRKQARYYKIMSHVHLSDYDLVCYHDANMVITNEPPQYTCSINNPSGKSAFQEAKDLISTRKERRTVVDRLMMYYSFNKASLRQIVFHSGFFVRTHDERMNELHQKWWNIVDSFSSRDRIAYTLAMYLTNIYPLIDNGLLRCFQVVNQHLYDSSIQPDPVNVHHITPGRSDKNIGKAINDLIKNLPEQDWICYRDIDTLPMNHEQFFRQCEEIAMNGSFDLIGCMTNRLGLERQLYKRQISDNPDINYHRQIAIELFEQYGSAVSNTNSAIGGLMMLFPKELWTRVGGFEEGYIVHPNGRYFDNEFYVKAKKEGARVGIADGIYLFHFYRFGLENPTIQKKHLF